MHVHSLVLVHTWPASISTHHAYKDTYGVTVGSTSYTMIHKQTVMSTRVRPVAPLYGVETK